MHRDRPLPYWREEIERNAKRHQSHQNLYSAGTIALAGGSVLLGAKSLINSASKMLRATSSSSSSSIYGDNMEEDPVNVSADTCGGTLDEPVHTLRNESKTGVTDGVKHYYGRVKVRSSFGKHDNMTHLMNMLFPNIRVKSRQYGTATIGSFTAIQLGGPQAFPSGGAIQNGLSETLFSSKSRQAMFQFQHLSGGTAAIGLYGKPYVSSLNVNNCPCSGVTFEGLLAYSRDSTNITARNTVFAPYTNSNAVEGFYNSLTYHGGKCTHHFYNTGTAQVRFSYRVCRPKRFLGRFYDPISLAVMSKFYQRPLSSATATASAIPNNTSEDANITSPMFKIESTDKFLHEYYLVTKSKHLVIEPGETASITVDHPKFEFTESEFNFGLVSGNMLAGTDDASYYPFCTSFLVCTILGQVATNDTGGTGNGLLNFGSCSLGHWQDEEHYLRSSIVQPPTQEIITNFITDSLVDGADVIVDTKTNTVVQSTN